MCAPDHPLAHFLVSEPFRHVSVLQQRMWASFKLGTVTRKHKIHRELPRSACCREKNAHHGLRKGKTTGLEVQICYHGTRLPLIYASRPRGGAHTTRCPPAAHPSHPAAAPSRRPARAPPPSTRAWTASARAACGGGGGAARARACGDRRSRRRKRRKRTTLCARRDVA